MEQDQCWAEAAKLIARGDRAAAVRLCQSKPCSETPECGRFLAASFYEGGDLTEALRWFSRGADRGDAESVFGVACVHHARKDFAEAMRHYERAAGLGYARAFHWIASMYQHGLGVTRDLGLAASYYEKSRAHGYLMGERGANHMATITRGWLSRIALWPRNVSLLVRTFLIALRNPTDRRLADISGWKPF